MAYKVTIHGIVNDGTSIFVTATITDGQTTMQPITPSFDSQTDPADIDAYFQAVANAAPTLSLALKALEGKTYTQA